MDSRSATDSPGPSHRRRSGRVVKKPDILGDQISTAGKRKRGEAAADDNEDEDLDEDEDDDEEEDGEPDEEELKARRKRARKSAPSKPKAPKKTQQSNGMNLAIRPAKKPKPARSRAKKAVRFSAAEDVGGLYADVFGRGTTLETVAAEWIGEYKKEPKKLVADLFTFLFRCAGCDHKVDPLNLEDPDSFSSQIDDIQLTYQKQDITEYPLISRAKGSAAFKQNFVGFIHALILTIAKSSILYEDTVLMENITSWISVMSATANRPFRHTATVAALSVATALCEVGRDLADVNSKLARQVDGEKKKSRSANKGRITEMEKNIAENAEKEKILKEQLDLWFDAVFVHRYRDVDHHIRLDCMQALSDWINTYPDAYYDPSYLRYFGWTLSDLNPPTRLEVLKSLIRLYKDPEKLTGMRTFTERFRPRMVEMATRDSDPGVRTLAIELIDVLRDAGFLEPTDIDAVGKLIFDSEPRVRKAVVKFFAQNVDDSYESRLEDLGGLESVDEIFGSREDEDEEYDSPRLEWLKLKCLVEVLIAYDSEDELESNELIPIPETDSYMFVRGMESRFSVAAEGLCEQIPELKWEVLAGYLLYDHSQAAAANGRGSDALKNFRKEVKLTDKEELLFLEVLNAAVKLDLARAVPHDRKLTKAQKVAEEDALEEGSRHLASLIPRLLNKFGATPEAASAILRLEHVIRPETQDASSYNALLEDVKKQFLTHAKPSVLQEATKSFLHAKAGDADEAAQLQVASLAEDAVQKISALSKIRSLAVRGNLDYDRLAILHSSVLRLEMLSSIEDIADLLETPPAETRKKASNSPSPFDTLMAVLGRAMLNGEHGPDVEAQEDNIVVRSARSLSFYFLWKVRAISKMISSAGIVAQSTIKTIQQRKERFAQAITTVLSARSGAEEIRLVLAVSLIDVFVAFAGLGHIKPAKRTNRQSVDAELDEEDAEVGRRHLVLVSEIPKDTQALLLQILAAAEKAFAKRTKRNLEEADESEEPGIEDDPEDDDDEDEEMDIDDDAHKESKLAADLVAEQRLCDLASGLVLGIWAAVLDGKKEGGKDMVRKRLKRNRAKLGHNFKSCIEALDKGGPLTVKGAKKPAAKKKTVSKPTIGESDEEDEDAPEEEELRDDSPEEIQEDGLAESVLGD